MPSAFYATEKQIDAIAYELMERFFKRVGGGQSMQDMDDLAEAIAVTIKAWVAKTPTLGGG
jgi:hypothetical protein